jgi:hypothetical protein
VEWDSKGAYRADPSLKNFAFTLKNPRNFPGRAFALKAEKKDGAIFCDCFNRPNFQNFDVCSGCSANSFACDFGKHMVTRIWLREWHRSVRKNFLHRFAAFRGEGNRSLRDHRLKGPSKSGLPVQKSRFPRNPKTARTIFFTADTFLKGAPSKVHFLPVTDGKQVMETGEKKEDLAIHAYRGS